jgi:hypothetical protein
MELQKLLKKVAVIQAHPDMMTADQIVEWFSVLRTIKDVRIDDTSGATPIRCKNGVFQSKFSIYVGDIAKINVTLTQVCHGSKKYSVSSTTEYCNGMKASHGTKEYNTVQKEVLRQQELFQQQQRASMRHAIEHHQHNMHQYMQHHMLHYHLHHHNHF